ncbi:uncharacterized protein LOC107630551 [Arachis ipaensis]|uniref:uncharacterized protein LOC107630551 n=1 Tax=Arachis ipaensis TaxID=130454 RepID=UPI0007AFABA7|nr:uncharacterized protein LOC107630551 [Arachis ipaensis]XP_025644692.1 uncharacterized protein LOC112738439 [Arachis hypogaea]QHO01594.1 uncharacterized protein DS421_13g416470 [Arachis hypogaea]QHO01595.1 uncharacterized protein DS421_13g416470 [Arachis hypogaea]QHO01596.1 uncharacterized protein DS421_13g416470 [Arachis hypogaea]
MMEDRGESVAEKGELARVRSVAIAAILISLVIVTVGSPCHRGREEMHELKGAGRLPPLFACRHRHCRVFHQRCCMRGGGGAYPRRICTADELWCTANQPGAAVPYRRCHGPRGCSLELPPSLFGSRWSKRLLMELSLEPLPFCFSITF